MAPTILRNNPKMDDDAWRFNIPHESLLPPKRAKEGVIYGKVISFSADAITLRVEQFPSNRVVHSDDPSKFILLSFGKEFRFPDHPPRVSGEYIARLLKTGFFLNDVQYRFYHHSNSQLRGRSCFLRQANNDKELDDRIYQLGDFARIMNIAKRAKRIGLLFSSAQIDYHLDPKFIADIPDIQSGDELFSDGCGLISRRLSIALSKKKRITFRNVRYTPTVFQIRYLGYKGVLMLHPQLDAEKKHLAQFRKSMKKFTTTADQTFSVVGHSKPYTFGRLNNDIIVLLSCLGVTNEKLLGKQDEYFQWLKNATEDPISAVDFLSCIDQYPLAGRVLLNGINDPDVAKEIRRLQLVEISRYTDEREKFKSRMIIRNSRRLFGVCDPYQVLKEGEVHIRIMASRKGPSTPIHGDVLIVRNPCLHPGDCLKLRAVHNEKLSHLVDCLVFASVARPGNHAAPSMSSGGDLDGDEFLVCWDKDLVPPRISESYDYPGNKERVSKKVTREDLAVHFASYNAAGLARVSALHNKWARYSPLGALSVECQELNALHSQSVDGAGIKIPDRLTKPPDPTEPFIIDLLEEAARKFAVDFVQSRSNLSAIPSLDAEEGQKLITQLFKSTQHAVSEYELFELSYRLSEKYKFDLRPYLGQIDWSALTTTEKRAISTILSLSAMDYPYIWNSLIKSDILTPQDLYSRSLSTPFSIQRLYSSKESGLTTFFEYLRMATQDYTRKLLVIQTDSRFSVGIFMRGDVPWDEEPEVNDNVVVCSFMPESSSTMPTQRPCTAGYRLHLSDSKMELYNKHRGDTFIFMNRPPRELEAEVVVSIALQKISTTVQRQLGRVNRLPVIAIELHVVSNHDRVAHQLFDLWFQHVPTEEYVRRFQRQAAPYRMNDLKDVDWTKEPDWLKAAFFPPRKLQAPSKKQEKHTQESMEEVLSRRMLPEIEQILDFGLMYHAEDEVFLVFHHVLSLQPLSQGMVIKWIDRYPPLVFTTLKAFPPDENLTLPPEIEQMTHSIVQAIIRSANDLRIASLVALEKIAKSIALLPVDEYVELLMLAALSVRSSQLVQEVLLVMNDIRLAHCPTTPVLAYGHKHALGVVFDRAEEAADECPCNEDGRPRKQRNPPSQTKLTFVPDDITHVTATLRVDARTAIRLHSHVRLQATSRAENRWIDAPVLDGLVVQAMKGELKIKLLQPAPPETERMDWSLFNAGSIATSRAMLDALLRLLTQKRAACQFYSFITGDEEEGEEEGERVSSVEVIPPSDDSDLNDSQRVAVNSWEAPLSLIWGPPGTGKTTVVVEILRSIIKTYYPQTPKILMTASTHNAVDNVLERFVKINDADQLLREENILRVATDQSKVNQDLQHFTIDARIGGDMNQNSRLVKIAQERVERAVLVFTTCAGAGLGILRKVDFDIAIIDEASQITEPCALIPLVKGIKRALMVGDHVQLRPTVKNMAKFIQFDISLLERLYSQSDIPGMMKTMLDVQYRSPEELNAFPSKEFYEGRLKTSGTNSTESLNALKASSFPWPIRDGFVIPTVFIPCSSEEDMGDRSKSNEGQVEVVRHVLKLLSTPKEGSEDVPEMKVTVLSPYTKQVKALRHRLPSSITSSTIDSFQGRESDIIIFSTVRCNVDGDVGFLDDPRRLNVMWTRARLALIIVGDRSTLSTNQLWKRALEACTEVAIVLEEPTTG